MLDLLTELAQQGFAFAVSTFLKEFIGHRVVRSSLAYRRVIFLIIADHLSWLRIIPMTLNTSSLLEI